MVLGVPRSGTSLVAGILHKLGVDMGEGYLQPADASNPTGYFENLKWQALHKRITGIRYGMNQPKTIDEEQEQAYRELAAECQRQRLWGMKCPRLCFTAQWVWPYLSDCRLVVVRREAQASVKSLVAHSIISYGGTLRMDERQAADLLAVWRGAMERRIEEFAGPMVNVPYERMVRDPNTWVRELARFAWDGLEGVRKPSDKELAAAMRFVTPGMNHHG